MHWTAATCKQNNVSAHHSLHECPKDDVCFAPSEAAQRMGLIQEAALPDLRWGRHQTWANVDNCHFTELLAAMVSDSSKTTKSQKAIRNTDTE